ncbi:MNIO family bufferin maturase [Gimibacter soli]|uniref:UPF0276 protein PH603_01100 n=1 Tax=Gimibacter soli TaxID=3024400 RepID=A0AAE9XNM0_9PROT|nr:DUF692 domain-containing protein [Gimibacter soli]WCL54353.1 DUF692 domain-containing protein [Gimibacter soli]
MAGKLDIAGPPAPSPANRRELAPGVGVGLKRPHLKQLLANPTSIDFVEVHAENFMLGGPNLEMLQDVARVWPVSVHGVALSLGGDDPLDRDHLARLRHLIDTVKPASFSEHIAWSRDDGIYLNDLLPIPYNRLTIDRMGESINEAQQYLGRRILLENPASYVRFRSDTLFEADFIAELVHRTGCGLLLDLNNLYVSARNHGWDMRDWLSRIQLGAVGEIHLAGHEQSLDEDGSPVLIDTHGDAVADAVWALYEDFLALAGPRPTLIERDNNIPPLAELLVEVDHARLLMRPKLAGAA